MMALLIYEVTSQASHSNREFEERRTPFSFAPS